MMRGPALWSITWPRRSVSAPATETPSSFISDSCSEGIGAKNLEGQESIRMTDEALGIKRYFTAQKRAS